MGYALITAACIALCTLAGAAAGFLFENIPPAAEELLTAAAAGIMLGAALLGLIVPSLELSGGRAPWLTPAGIVCGALFLSGLGTLTPYLSRRMGAEADAIAAALGIKRSEVVLALDSICEPVSLYEPVYSDSGESVCVMDQIGDTKNTDEHWLEQIALGEAVSRLSERERRILSLRFYLGRTQTEVAREIGISQAQVSRLEKNAIGRIKKELGS